MNSYKGEKVWYMTRNSINQIKYGVRADDSDVLSYEMYPPE